MDTLTSDQSPDFPGRPGRSLGNSDPLHVSGAGTLGISILVGSLTILFLSSLIAFVYYRSDFLKSISISLPDGLWLSTLILLASSVTMHVAKKNITQDHDRTCAHWLTATLILGLAFLAMQVVNWLALNGQLHQSQHAVSAISLVGQSKVGGLSRADAAVVERHVLFVAFYMFTVLHALHVIAGLIPLGVVNIKAYKGRYSCNYYPGIRYINIYWHFLDAIWLVIFVTLLLTF
ncbi:MAG: cytochrome c oxidase subunit 3 [Phycisphaerae bacterium]